MGRTILITVGEPRIVDGIPLYAGIVYLYPTDAGGWNLLDLDVPDPAATYTDLESAVHSAHAYVADKERASR